MELKFSAKGTDNQNWFSVSKLTHSSQWSDIKTESKNYFSVSGDTSRKRHFFINRGYAGNCAGDTGWMVIAGKECDWERGHHHKNPILYSKLSKYTTWEKKSELTNTLCLYDINVSILFSYGEKLKKSKPQKGIEFLVIGILSHSLGDGEGGCGLLVAGCGLRLAGDYLWGWWRKIYPTWQPLRLLCRRLPV